MRKINHFHQLCFEHLFFRRNSFDSRTSADGAGFNTLQTHANGWDVGAGWSGDSLITVGTHGQVYKGGLRVEGADVLRDISDKSKQAWRKWAGWLLFHVYN